MTLPRFSPRRRAALPAEAAFREQLVNRCNGRCEFCGQPGTDQHELGRGPLRQLCRCCWFAVLYLCRACHRVLDERLASDDAQKCGLAILRRSRPEDFDLAAFNRVINPRAPNRITEAEVNDWVAAAELERE
jgi:hypothetical protein